MTGDVNGRAVWPAVLANTLILLVLLAAILTPLALVLNARYAEAQGTPVPSWSDVTLPETQRTLGVIYVVLIALQVVERVVRREDGWPRRRRGATMAAPGSRLVPAPPAGDSEGSANEKGSNRNGRQVTQSNAEEEP